uniref:Uncharacterized protein n=1 Tax=Picea glauca TaxID=3330 RepID=A0A101M0R9_PICGL|nr:hypothetical protein ABT39_MTgene4205 [Picea glauca]QHR87053.1 hypothetical protein Q903MT_gene1062 [Picea sitchensis]
MVWVMEKCIKGPYFIFVYDVQSPVDLIIYRTSENEVVFLLSIIKRTKLTYRVHPRDVMIRLNTQLTGESKPSIG